MSHYANFRNEVLAVERAPVTRTGRFYWNEVANGFLGNLGADHTSEFERGARGTLTKNVLERLRDYIVAHQDEPIEVAALADIAGRSPFHYSRVFARSVGMTPHRYVVHPRLQCAIELVRERRSGLAEISARTGFADQNHLWRWVRRVHGVPLTRLVGSYSPNSRNVQDSRSLLSKSPATRWVRAGRTSGSASILEMLNGRPLSLQPRSRAPF